MLLYENWLLLVQNFKRMLNIKSSGLRFKFRENLILEIGPKIVLPIFDKKKLMILYLDKNLFGNDEGRDLNERIYENFRKVKSTLNIGKNIS